MVFDLGSTILSEAVSTNKLYCLASSFGPIVLCCFAISLPKSKLGTGLLCCLARKQVDFRHRHRWKDMLAYEANFSMPFAILRLFQSIHLLWSPIKHCSWMTNHCSYGSKFLSITTLSLSLLFFIF